MQSKGNFVNKIIKFLFKNADLVIYNNNFILYLIYHLHEFAYIKICQFFQIFD